MIKSIILTLMSVLALASVSFAQLHVVIEVDSLQISWAHDWKDVNGNLEHVIKFKVFIKRNEGAYMLIGETAEDRVNYRPEPRFTIRNLQDNSRYEFGVVAVDWAGNESIMHKSVDVTAHWGGWYVLVDATSPSAPAGLRP